ncbi:Ultraviolet-B receptor UVR8 [Carex littledalei]|uniref:Ultraviolet-B receptor UVR8 n=1 Tax=Carex littledalei TaxID=544730 RepID=A0A833RQX2_9POAL|nr:Ultraviolet-B receptor UVR8 [Carex littledalei]
MEVSLWFIYFDEPRDLQKPRLAASGSAEHPLSRVQGFLFDANWSTLFRSAGFRVQAPPSTLFFSFLSISRLPPKLEHFPRPQPLFSSLPLLFRCCHIIRIGSPPIFYKPTFLPSSLFRSPSSRSISCEHKGSLSEASDLGQVWGWGYGGEGQLGLGSRIRTVSSPHPIPCIDTEFYGKDRASSMIANNRSSEGALSKVTGTCVKAIACGGRHSAVVTDSGALLTFGWGLYGQCGLGSTDDLLSPTCVQSILGVKMRDVYSFGGNQFGQLGTGSDQAETVPKLVEASCLENKHARAVSCGARHSAMITGT